MYPDYLDGTRVRVNLDAYRNQTPQPKDVVLARHPYKTGVHIIKRISHITNEGRYFVVGDNLLESSDSRSFGPLNLQQILGKVMQNEDL